MSAFPCTRCGQRPATHTTLCGSCFDRWLLGKMFGFAPRTEAEQVAREDAAEIRYEREIMGERPAARPDPTKMDRAA